MELSLATPAARPGAGGAGGVGSTCMIALVRVQGRLIGVDGRHIVQAVVVPPDMAAVPRRAGGLVGVVSHGTQLVPVVHLQRWLDADDGAAADADAPVDDSADDAPAPVPPSTPDARIVILSHDGQVVGLMVDAVIGLRRCPQDAVERLFHDERPDELFERAALIDAAEPPLALLEPSRLAALAGAWCARARVERVAADAEQASVDEAARRALAASASLGVFRIGDALVGFPANDIGELLRTPALRAPPFRHPGVRGLCDWRGQLLPVVDLTAALRAVPDAQPAPWLCVVRHGELALGVLVQESFGLTSIAADRLDAATAGDGGGPGALVRCELPIERGILHAIDSRALMSHCPESALSARREAAAQHAAAARSTKPYMVFESAGVFASEVGCVQEVLPLPEAVRARLAAGSPASIAWRGHAVPVRDVLAAGGEALPLDEARQLIVVAHGDRRVAVPIAGVRAMIPAHAGTLARLSVGGRDVEVVSTMTSEHRATYAVVDLSAHVMEREALRQAA